MKSGGCLDLKSQPRFYFPATIYSQSDRQMYSVSYKRRSGCSNFFFLTKSTSFFIYVTHVPLQHKAMCVCWRFNQIELRLLLIFRCCVMCIHLYTQQLLLKSWQHTWRKLSGWNPSANKRSLKITELFRI